MIPNKINNNSFVSPSTHSMFRFPQLPPKCLLQLIHLSQDHTRTTHRLHLVIRSLLSRRQLDSSEFRNVSGQGCASLGRQSRGTQTSVFMAECAGTCNSPARHKLRDGWGVPGSRAELCLYVWSQRLRLPEGLGTLTPSGVAIRRRSSSRRFRNPQSDTIWCCGSGSRPDAQVHLFGAWLMLLISVQWVLSMPASLPIHNISEPCWITHPCLSLGFLPIWALSRHISILFIITVLPEQAPKFETFVLFKKTTVYFIFELEALLQTLPPNNQ